MFPPRLRVPDEVDPRVPRQHPRELVDAAIVVPMLEVHQHGNAVLARDRGHQVDARESASTGNFCSPMPRAPILRYRSITGRASGISGSSLAKKRYSFGYCRAIATTVSLPPAPAARPYFDPAGNSDRDRNAHVTLVRDQFRIAAPAVTGVLMDVDNRLRRLGQQRRRERCQKCTARDHARQNTSYRRVLCATAASIMLSKERQSGTRSSRSDAWMHCLVLP
mgnify:CR=1 FL=1